MNLCDDPMIKGGSEMLMPPWLLLWFARWASGERFRKATPEDYRTEFGSLFFVGAFMIVGTIFGRRFLDQASSVRIWVWMTIAMCVLVFGAIVWARRVPALVSLVLGIVTWGVFVWLALREGGVL
jgi:hypothetical protein